MRLLGMSWREKITSEQLLYFIQYSDRRRQIGRLSINIVVRGERSPRPVTGVGGGGGPGEDVEDIDT